MTSQSNDDNVHCTRQRRG